MKFTKDKEVDLILNHLVEKEFSTLADKIVQDILSGFLRRLKERDKNILLLLLSLDTKGEETWLRKFLLKKLVELK